MTAAAEARDALLRDERELFDEVVTLIRSLDDGQLTRAGYNGSWSVKDMLAHLTAWMLDGATDMDAIVAGTFEPTPGDVDEMNERFYDEWKDRPLDDVMARFTETRGRLARTFRGLDDAALEAYARRAEVLFREEGPEHYREHLPRLRAWAEELRAA